MAKGDGSITEVRRGVWRVRIDFGTNPVTGKRTVVSRNVHGTKAEARKVRDQIRREHESGLTVDGDKLTFREFADSWHSSRVDAGEVSSIRLDRERNQIKLLSGYIGDQRLRDITPQTVESLYAAIRRDKVKARGKCSGTTMNQKHKLLKQIMKKAVDFELILRNPCDRVRAPRCETPERRSLTVDEGIRLLECVGREDAEAYAALTDKEARQTERGNLFGRSYLRGLSRVGNVVAVRIGLATGMRRGEVFGLTWGSVALNQAGISSISVRQAITAKGELKAPKGKDESSIRVLSIDACTADHMREWKMRQALELLKLGIKQNDSTPVCCSDKGGYMNLANFERWWRIFRNKYGFDDLKFHELRHTQATQLLANGYDVKTVQTRMGHASATLTLNQYAHAIPENDESAARFIGDLFTAKPVKGRLIELKTA